MTLRQLYNLLLKIIGLLFLKDLITTIPEFFGLLFYGFDKSDVLGGLIPLIIILITCLACMYFLLFKTDQLIDKFKLAPVAAEGGTLNSLETFNFNIHRSTALRIAITIISGLILVDNIPIILSQLYNFVKSSDRKGMLGIAEPFRVSWLIIPLCKLALSIIMLVYQREIINMFEVKRRKGDLKEIAEGEKK